MVASSRAPERRALARIRAAWLLARLFGVARVAAHPGQALTAALAIAVGVAVLFAVLLLDTSMAHSFDSLAHALHGDASLEVTDYGPGLVPAELVARIRALPGVRAAAPVLEKPAVISAGGRFIRATIIGVDASIAELAGAGGFPLEGRRVGAGQTGIATAQLAAALQLAPGAIVRVTAGERSFRVRIAGGTDDAARDALHGRFLIVPLEMAQWLFRQPDAVSSVYVAARPAAGPQAGLRAQIAAAVGSDFPVVPVGDRLAELREATAALRSFAAFASVLALVVGAYLVFNAVAMWSAASRHALGVLLALGEAPRRLLARALLEASLVGSAGSAAGWVAGYALGGALVASLPVFVQGPYAGSTQLLVTPLAALLALAMGVAAALAGALAPALALLRLQPADALRPVPARPPEAARRGTRVLALAAVVALASAPWVGQTAGWPARALLATSVAGALLALPAAIRLALVRLQRALAAVRARVGAGVLQVAGAGLAENLQRSVAAVVAASLSIATIVAIGGATRNLDASFGRFSDALAAVDVYVASLDDPYATVPLDAALAATAAHAPGVAQVRELRSTFVRWQGRRVWLRGDDPSAIAAWNFVFVAGDRAAIAAALGDDGVLVSTQIAHRGGARPGATIELPTARGRHAFRVLGVFESWAWAPGTLVISGDAFRRWYGDSGPNQLAIQATAGTAPEALAAALRAVSPASAVTTGAALRAETRAAWRRQLAPFRLLRGAAALLIAIVVLQTAELAIAQRQRQLAVLRAIGLTRGGLAAALLAETAALMLLAAVAGLALGSFLQALGLNFMAGATGLPLRWALEWRSFADGLGVAVVAALAGAAYPTWRAARAPIAGALVYE